MSARLNLVRIYLNKKEVEEPKHGPNNNKDIRNFLAYKNKIRTTRSTHNISHEFIYFPETEAKQPKNDLARRWCLRLCERRKSCQTFFMCVLL